MNEVINSCLTALNNIGRGFCDYTAGIFVQSSVLIVLLLLIDFILRKRVRAVFRYCVWMLVFVKLILPPTLSLPTGIGYWYGDYLSADSPVLQQVSNVVRPEHAGTPAPEDFALSAEVPQDQPSQINPQIAAPVTSGVSGLNAITWQAFVFLLWLVGVLVISVLLIQRMLFVKGLIAQSEPAKNRLLDMLNQCRRQVGIGRNMDTYASNRRIELRLTNNISCPAVCGLFKPVILIPTALLEKLSPDRLRAVLIHELVHIKRADIWVNLVQTVLQIIYFYNPFVWLANAVVRRVREQAVDEMVLVSLGAGAENYSNTLIDIAEMAFWKTSLSLRLIGVVESKKALHRRIKHMLNRPIPKSAKVGIFGTIVIIVIAAALLPMAKAQKSDKTDTAVAKPGRHITLRQVWAGTDWDCSGAPSPDGRYLSYVDWGATDLNHNDLAIYEIATGKKRRLTDNASWYETGEYQFALSSIWSPDGKQIAYQWWSNLSNLIIELCVIGLDGSKPRILYRAYNAEEEEEWIRPYDWTPDGRQILACVTGKDGKNKIVLVSAADGSVRVLKTLDKYYGHKESSWYTPSNMSFSPDGRYIVYDFPKKEDYQDHDIYLMSTDGSREIPLVEHPAHEYVIGWAPEGKNILFASDRTGTMGVWLIAVADGKPQGTPELIKPDIGRFHPMGFTNKGSLYYGISKGKTDVYIAELDPETGKILGQPKKAIKRFEGSNRSSDYSPDGKYLAYISDRGLRNVLCIRSLETGKEREFSLNLNSIVRAWRTRWSPYCRSILFSGEDNKDRSGIYKIDVQTGDFTSIVMSGIEGSTYSGEWSHDGKSIFYVRGDSKAKINQIIVRDLETGTEKELYRSSSYGLFNISLSPDGQWFALLGRSDINNIRIRSLKVMPVTGGEPRELCRFEKKGTVEKTITWTADGKYILFAWEEEPAINLRELYRIPAEGGEIEKLGLKMRVFHNVSRSLSVHPDGKHIAFCSPSPNIDMSCGVWVMENFLPTE